MIKRRTRAPNKQVAAPAPMRTKEAPNHLASREPKAGAMSMENVCRVVAAAETLPIIPNLIMIKEPLIKDAKDIRCNGLFFQLKRAMIPPPRAG